MSKEMSIFDMLTTRSMEAVYEDVGKKLKDNKRYSEYLKEMQDNLLQIDKKLGVEISDTVSAINTEVQDAAYSQGFSCICQSG